MKILLHIPTLALAKIGSLIIKLNEGLGDACLFLLSSMIAVLKLSVSPFQCISQLYHVGALSSAVIALIGLFTGAVLAVQGEYTLSKFGAVGYTGSAVALSLIRELGPVLTALMVIGRAGSAMTAELGIMKITEQIDALKSMAVNPTDYLIAPRILAGIIAMPLLNALFVTVGIGGGYLVATNILGLSSGTYVSEMFAAVSQTDIYSSFIKSLVFGILFGWICSFKGYTCGWGAIGVNRATTQAVVTSSVSVLVVDYFLTSILTRVL